MDPRDTLEASWAPVEDVLKLFKSLRGLGGGGFQALLWSIWKPQRAPKQPPRAPKRSHREAEHTVITIFGFQTLVY